MLKLGTFELDIPFIQAPLAGYTDYSMRILARQAGCPLTFTGVMLDKIALHPKAIRQYKFQPRENEHPVGAQVLGDSPQTLAKAAGLFEKIGYDVIDLNFACPAPKVLRRGRGGSLMQNPAFIREAYQQARQEVSGPLFMKIRIGYDHSDASTEAFWQIIENAAADKVDMVAIHGRTVDQKYRGRADWDRIAEAKNRFPNLTIFGSGDIMTAQTAVDRLKTSGVDGIVVARGAIGNPWIFEEIRALYENTPLPTPPTIAEQGQMMLDHFRMICEDFPEKKAVPYFRKFTANYCKRHPQRKKTMLTLMAQKSSQELIHNLKEAYGLE